MGRALPLRALAAATAAAALLSGAGCDYLDNLTNDKTLDKGGLSVTVIDAWTREPIAGATCSGEGIAEVPTDGGGKAGWVGLPTGVREIHCRHPSYFPRTGQADLPASGLDSMRVELARDPKDWYPDIPGRRVTIGHDSGNYRFPGAFRLKATPDQSGGIFRYEWSCSHAGIRPAGNKDSWQVALPGWTDPLVRLSFALKVTATLAGRTYVVDSAEYAFDASRNMPPVITVGTYSFKDQAEIRVGCNASQDNIRLSFQTHDPDGDCRKVTLKSSARSTSVSLDTTLSCGATGLLTFPLKSHSGLPDAVERRENEIIITAMDDNGETATDTLRLTTVSNLHPGVLIERLNPTDKTYEDTKLEFQVRAWDRDAGFLDFLEVDWGDGQKETRPSFSHFTPDTALRTFSHFYMDSGRYEITARVRERCGAVADSMKLTMIVSPSLPPSIRTLESRGHLGGKFNLRVEALAPDVRERKDSLLVYVEWGDRTGSFRYASEAGRDFMSTLTHEYDPQLPDSAFRIELTVQDTFGGTANDTLWVSRKAALGLP